jgi:hypothetical protein
MLLHVFFIQHTHDLTCTLTLAAWAQVDERVLTGECVSAEKPAGALLMAGSVNQVTSHAQFLVPSDQLVMFYKYNNEDISTGVLSSNS